MPSGPVELLFVLLERERERSVYLHQTFSINYRLKHTQKKTMILRFKIKQTDNKPYSYIKSKSTIKI